MSPTGNPKPYPGPKSYASEMYCVSCRAPLSREHKKQMTTSLPGSDTRFLSPVHASSAKEGSCMHEMWSNMKSEINRRSFMKNGIAAAGVGLLTNNSSHIAEKGPEERSGSLTFGDAAMLRFAAAAEILETDFWEQYNELGGIQDNEVPGGTGNPIYTQA